LAAVPQSFEEDGVSPVRSAHPRRTSRSMLAPPSFAPARSWAAGAGRSGIMREVGRPIRSWERVFSLSIVVTDDPKYQRGATPKRHRPSGGKAQTEQSKSACTQRLRH